MEQRHAAPTTDSPVITRPVRASIEPRGTHRPMLACPTKSSGLSRLTQNIIGLGGLVQEHRRRSVLPQRLRRKCEPFSRHDRLAHGGDRASSDHRYLGAMQSRRHRGLASLFLRFGFQWWTCTGTYWRTQRQSTVFAIVKSCRSTSFENRAFFDL